MKEFIAKIKNSGAYKTLINVLASKYFPFITCAAVLLCYYLGWDMAVIYYTGLAMILILLLLEDISPVVSVFLFMNVLISRKNSPSVTTGGSDYFFQTHVTVQIIVIIVLVVAAVVYRLVKMPLKKQFKPTPVFYGLCLLAAAFILNGAFSAGYAPTNLVYGVFMAFFFLAVFVLLKDNIRTDEETFIRIAFGFLALSVLLLIELTVAYITTDNLFIDGEINRNSLMFGWGVYNTLGMLLVICIPPVFYLAYKYGKGGFLIYAFVIFTAAFLSTSRQAMIGAAVIFPVCLIILLVKGGDKIFNLCITAAALIIAIVLLCVYYDKIYAYFDKVFENLIVDGNLYGSGRWLLWQTGWKEFLSAPLFGTGFYAELPESLDTVGLSIIPLMYHNTFIQLLAACGIIGFAAYVAHRVQTILSFFKNVTIERAFIALSVVALLIINLFDNHLFYILPTLVYSSLIAVLVKSENKPKISEIK